MRQKITIILIGIFFMGVTSLLALFVVSLLTYGLKWQADNAMIGITITYIAAGGIGGLSMKWMPRLWKRRQMEAIQIEETMEGVAGKIIESLLAGSVFMLLLVILSFFFVVDGVQISGRLFLIWMLLAGSAALGRIL